jgi:hypothetical protein
MKLKSLSSLVLMVICVNVFAWRVDYSLALPGNSAPQPDVINYLIFSKELVSKQNENMYNRGHNSSNTSYPGTR